MPGAGDFLRDRFNEIIGRQQRNDTESRTCLELEVLGVEEPVINCPACDVGDENIRQASKIQTVHRNSVRGVSDALRRREVRLQESLQTAGQIAVLDDDVPLAVTIFQALAPGIGAERIEWRLVRRLPASTREPKGRSVTNRQFDVVVRIESLLSTGGKGISRCKPVPKRLPEHPQMDFLAPIVGFDPLADVLSFIEGQAERSVFVAEVLHKKIAYMWRRELVHSDYQFALDLVDETPQFAPAAIRAQAVTLPAWTSSLVEVGMKCGRGYRRPEQHHEGQP